MAIGNKYQHLKKSHKHRDWIYMPLTVLPKCLNLSLQSLDPATNFQEILRTHLELHYEHVISKIQTVVNSTSQMAQAIQQINCKELRKG